MPVDLAALNVGQLEAVHAPIDKPVLVIAGAGSGKTTTLTARLEHLVSTGVDPAAVVAMTFTRKAAGELADRLDGGPAAGVWSGTIHSFAYARLRAYREACGDEILGVIPHPKSHIRRLIGRPSTGYEEAVAGAPELDLSAVLSRIGHWQNELIDPARAIDEADDYVDRWSAVIFDAYTRWKRRPHPDMGGPGGLIDFGDMLTLAVDAYDADPVFLEGDRDRFRYGLVDELQDTNTAQWKIAHLLWRSQPVFGVGDPRQAIYEWRGARPSQLLSFADLWPGVEIVRLVDNYRSTPEIIEVAESLMEGTEESSASGRLVPTRPSMDPPQLIPVLSMRAEASEIATDIRNWIDPTIPGSHPLDPGKVAVLYRTNAQSADLEDALADLDIPYQVVGSKGFWARSEVRQLLAYLELADDPSQGDAFSQALRAPSRFLGKAFIEATADLAAEEGWSLVEACAHVTAYANRRMHPGQMDAAADFTTLIRSLVPLEPKAALERVLTKTDFRSWLLRDEGSADAADDDREDVIAKLVDQAGLFSTRADLLAHAEKMRSKSSAGSKPDPMRVQLMTIHRAKGLEWDVVYVAGFSNGLLPHHRGNLAEERRLAYVAMTRARDSLTLYSPLNTFKGPTEISRFASVAGLSVEITEAQP